VLRVLVKSNLSRDEAIATIAHELQHVVEVATAAPGAGADDMSAVFAKLDPAAKVRGTYKHETDAAIDVTSRVRDELRRVSWRRLSRHRVHRGDRPSVSPTQPSWDQRSGLPPRFLGANAFARTSRF
jgi:hypothetical protein